MTDAAQPRVAAAVERVRGPACWLARAATTAAALATPAALALWVGADAPAALGDWPRGTLGALVLLAVVLAPVGWLLNVRAAITALLALPETLGGIARRRGGQLRRPRDAAPTGLVGAARSVRAVVRDHRDVVGSWGLVAQLVSPGFWLLTAAAAAAVPLLWLVAAVVLLVSA